MRSPELVAALERAGIVPCGDRACIFGSPEDSGQSRGCRCFNRATWMPDVLVTVRRLVLALRFATGCGPDQGPREGDAA